MVTSYCRKKKNPRIMKEFFEKNFKLLLQITVVGLLVILIFRSCTATPDRSELLMYKLEQIDNQVKTLRLSNQKLDKKIENYNNDIRKIDSTIKDIKIQRTIVNNYYEDKKRGIIGMNKKQIDSTLKARYTY